MKITKWICAGEKILNDGEAKKRQISSFALEKWIILEEDLDMKRTKGNREK